MADSLVLGNVIQLLGGGVSSQIPACEGAVFRLAPGWDLSAPQPTTDFVASLILDGERPFGRRASNRTIKLPVVITAPDRIRLAAAREILEQCVDQDRWTITWIRDPGDGDPLPLLIDCFRASATTPAYNLRAEQHLVHAVELTIPALPYGRADVQTRVAFATPVPASPPPPPAPVLLDNFEAISSTRHYQSPRCVIGPHSLCWDPDDDRVGDPGGHNTQFTYSATLGYTQDLTGYTSLQMYLGFGSRWHHCLEYHGHTHGVRVYVTLTDADGHTITAERTHLRLPVSPNWQAPTFTRVSMAIPQAAAGFDYTAVVAYSVTIVNRHFPLRLSWVTAYVDNLTAYPPSVQAQPVTRGSVFTLHGIEGTARAACSMTFIQPPSAGSPTTYTTPGIGNYTVPAGTAWLKVEAIGGGGPGATRTTAGVGGGGGGGEYSREDVFPAQAGQQVPYSVPAAASPGNDGAAAVFGPGPSGSLVVVANGGKAAAQNTTAGGAGGSGSANSVHHPGGAGRTASGSVGGGGGGSGGTAASGLSPTGTAADVRTATGAGTWTCPAGVTQVFAECWGSGGSGATGNSGNGAGGSGAEYAAGYVAVTPGNTYNYSIAAGGAAVSGSAQNGNDGAASWFTGDSVTITANGGKKGLFRSSSGGGGAGGTGSTAPVHFNGGAGGSAMPYSGGGGSSAGPSAAGNSGDGYGNGGTAPTDGGKGGSGSGATSNNGGAGQQPGGGGGGTYGPRTSGAGGNGKLRLTYPGGAPTSNGAAAVAGGGAGGAGGATTGSTGTAGQQPGGGGGGGNSSGTTVAGGNGGAGKLIITPYASQPFKQLIAHRPPLGTPRTFQPLVSVGGGSDTPNGGTAYVMPQPADGVNADFAGTYTVLLTAASWSGGSGSSTPRTITVTATQWEYAGGPGYTTSCAVSVAPNQTANGLVTCGVLTLPVKATAPDNTAGYYSIAITSSNTGDRFNDCLLLDTMGQTLILNLTSGYITYYADAPDPDRDLGFLLGTQTDRTQAISVLDAAIISGGPLHVEPSEGDNQLLVYSADGLAPNVALNYFPAYFFDRIT